MTTAVKSLETVKIETLEAQVESLESEAEYAAERQQALIGSLEMLAIVGLKAETAETKQWALEQLAAIAGVNLDSLVYDRGTEPFPKPFSTSEMDLKSITPFGVQKV